MDKKRITLFIDGKTIETMRTKYSNFNLSKMTESFYNSMIAGKPPEEIFIQIQKENELVTQAAQIGKIVGNAIIDSHNRIEEAKALSLERQDELEKRVKEWRSLFAQGTNEGSKIAETQALNLKRNIMEEFGLDSVQFVKLAWGN